MRKRRPITQSQQRLEGWIHGLEGQPDWVVLLDSLKRIREGEDANIVFGINRGRGRNVKQSEAAFRNGMATVLVASAMREYEIDRAAAVTLMAKELNMRRDTLVRYAQKLNEVLDAEGNFNPYSLIPKN